MDRPERERAEARDLPDLAELCHLYEIGLDLISRATDLDDLILKILDEYESRLAALPTDAFDPSVRPPADTARKVRALVMFAGQAVALKTQAQVTTEARARAERFGAALKEAERARARLEAVLAAVDAGIVLVDTDGTIAERNGAAKAILGAEGSPGRFLPAPFASVPRGGGDEIEYASPAGTTRTLMVARRGLGATGQDGDVWLFHDVTSRDAAREERHRLEKFEEVLNALGVLSHKINNPLTALLGRAQLLRARKSDDPHVTKAAEVIEESASRIATLIRELAAVVKEGRQEAVARVLDLGAVRRPDDSGR